MTTTNAPFLLEPRFAKRIWGRTDLSPWYTTDPAQTIGEAWLTGPECRIATGDRAGQPLGDFPLLVKILFPNEKLSVQVHPNDAEAQASGLERGKTECWYVLESQPGATVACGLRDGITPADLARGVADGTAEDMMQMLPVVPGDMVFVDAGTVHAIGPGVTLLEVQQTSDVTYRLYDYGRPRELHLEAGLAVVKTNTRAGKVPARPMDGFTRLIDTEYFIVDRFDLAPGAGITLPMDSLGCLISIAGTAQVDSLECSPGQAAILPEGTATVRSPAGCTLVRCTTPA